MLKKNNIIFSLLCFISYTNIDAFKLMLNTSLHDQLAKQCIQQMQNDLKKQFPNIKIIIPEHNKKNTFLHAANIANQLQIDFYLHISFFQEAHKQPQIYIYQYINKPTDFWQKKPSTFSFVPYDHAHYFSVQKSKRCAMTIKNSLEKITKHQIHYYAIPYKPLIGIMAPAIAIEFGVNEMIDWEKQIEPLIKILPSFMQKLNNT